MTQPIRMFCLAAILALVVCPAFAEDDVTFEGAFVWAREDGDRNGVLEAIFTPSGKGTWDVAFHFDWEEKPHVYTGTCSGSLDGELTGDIVGDGERKPKFRFSGKFEDGTFSGTHQFLDDEGKGKDSGTLTLSSKN